MRVATTCNKDGFDVYGHRAIEGWNHWPKSAEFYFYVEGFDVPDAPRVIKKDITKLNQLENFKRRYGRYAPPNYMFDVVKFSNKVFAAVDAFRDYKEIGVWMDADCVTFKDIPDTMFSDLLDSAYIGVFQRNTYTETGLWIVDCSHELHIEFMETWASWYESDGFKTIQGGWTDCHTLDATIRRFKNAIKVTNLSGKFSGDPHPMSKVGLAQYIDHCKGPRKISGKSPENKHHKK